MLIHWSEADEAFVVTLPEFDNCKTHGVTYEEAVKSAEAVLELLVEAYSAEGKELPQPHYTFA
jgi:predicted RNase H-like HicB family nuclease